MDNWTKLKIGIGFGLTIMVAIFVAIKGKFFLTDFDGFGYTVVFFWALMVLVIFASSIVLGTVNTKIKWIHPILSLAIFIAIVGLVYGLNSFGSISSTLVYPVASIIGLLIGTGVTRLKQRMATD